MKKILGLDLGTTSVGWALVNEAENKQEQSSIMRLGVRLISLDNFTQTNGKDIKLKKEDAFSKGIGISTRAARRSAKSSRVNGRRYRQRREELKHLLRDAGCINSDTLLCEDGKNTTYQTLGLRARAVTDEISLSEFARVLLAINKKRGYKSNRKLKASDEGDAIDGMSVARTLCEEQLTPGQYVNRLYEEGRKYIPQFYPSDLREEFRAIWQVQSEYHEAMTNELYDRLQGREEKATWAILAEGMKLEGIKREGKRDEQKRENYRWRVEALSHEMDAERLAIVLSRINAEIAASSGYLGSISDRSKELIFKHQTIGQYLYDIISKDRHKSLKRRVFYREDYLDEFEKIWETQSKYHPEVLTPSLKKQIKGKCIFFQRDLKSQKHLLDFCTFEQEVLETVREDGKQCRFVKGQKVCPKSSPLFQEFRLLQMLNNTEIIDRRDFSTRLLTEKERQTLYVELNLRDKMKKGDVLKALKLSNKVYDLNYDELKGNVTRTSIFKRINATLPVTGHDELDDKVDASLKLHAISSIYEMMGYEKNILEFDSSITGHAIEQQSYYRLWHLLYSSDGKNLNDHIAKICNYNNEECAKIVAKASFEDGYSNLSAKAIRRILPHLRAGLQYDKACLAAGYRHSEHSITKEENEQRALLDTLPTYRSGALRNPVVDKVLAQVTNVVNSIIKEYGRPDEIRVEMAREMKKSAKERQDAADSIKRNTDNTERIKKLLADEFGITSPSRNDITRWRLYEELEANGFKTLYSNTYIHRDQVFSREFDIEHIIPQARLFDDSFGNKTLELVSVNGKKGALTAYDYMAENCSAEDLDQYEKKINTLLRDGAISKTKHDHLLMRMVDIPDDFIQRDLRETQYICRAASQMLEQVVRSVVVTTGSITDYLREKWQLVDVMKELNMPLYEKLGMVRVDINRDNKEIRRIEGWTKRSDNRHHAMDALTVAFTKRSFIQYLNTLNANYDKVRHEHPLEAPMPLAQFRAEALKQLSQVLVSSRTSQKVGTYHVNKADGRRELTPRGKLHAETYYRKITNEGNPMFVTRKDITPELKIEKVIDKHIREILADRLRAYGNDPKKAFANLDENPIWFNQQAGLRIKKVTVQSGKDSNPLSIHSKRDKNGRFIVDAEGHNIPNDYVAADGNHHIAFFRDAKGKLHEHIVSFFEAVVRKSKGWDVIDTNYNSELGWKFLFSLQRGEYVVFPDDNFVPHEIDLTNESNFAEVSPHLFTVQKLSSKYYNFRHHLDPSTNVEKELQDVNWKRIRNVSALMNLVKVRLDSLGRIVSYTEIDI